jgi:DNA-binding IclR family transcriptional regulator
LIKHTPHTTTDRANLESLIAEAQVKGYAVAEQEYYRGDIALAAPVIGIDGDAVAAVNISVPNSRWTLEEARRRLAPIVIETARGISIVNAQGQGQGRFSRPVATDRGARA